MAPLTSSSQWNRLLGIMSVNITKFKQFCCPQCDLNYFLQIYDSQHVLQDNMHHHCDHIMGDGPIRDVATKDSCAKKCCQFFHHDKIKSLWHEMWFKVFRMQLTKKLKVHHNIHIDAHGYKVMTLRMWKHVVLWYIIYAISKDNFYIFQKYSFMKCHPRFHGNSSTKKPMEATLQATTTLSTIIVPLANGMSHKYTTSIVVQF